MNKDTLEMMNEKADLSLKIKINYLNPTRSVRFCPNSTILIHVKFIIMLTTGHECTWLSFELR